MLRRAQVLSAATIRPLPARPSSACEPGGIRLRPPVREAFAPDGGLLRAEFTCSVESRAQGEMMCVAGGALMDRAVRDDDR
jgi:hypothetical protein